MNVRQNDEVRLNHVLEAIRNISLFTKGLSEVDFLKNRLVQSAVERQLEIIGEASARLSESLKGKFPEIEWNKIKAFRNIIAHEYFGVSSKQVWQVIQKDLLLLKKQLQKVLKAL